MKSPTCNSDKSPTVWRYNSMAYNNSVPNLHILRSEQILKINTGSHADKYVDIANHVVLTYSWIKSTDVPLFVLYVFMCIEMSSNEIFNAKDQVL